MTQPDKKLQNRWEKKLKKCGLGIVQPLTDNSEGEMQVVTNGRIDKMTALRKKVDGNDRFMDAHQIMKISTKEREVPEWALNDGEVQRILLVLFPSWKTHSRQRKRAGIYARIIHLYWRMKLPETVVTREMGISKILLDRKIQTLTRTAKGLNNRGVPRKRGVSHQTPPVGSTETNNVTIQSPPLLRAGNGGNGEDRTPKAEVQMPQAGELRGSE
jgi:hypothetical protein